MPGRLPRPREKSTPTASSGVPPIGARPGEEDSGEGDQEEIRQQAEDTHGQVTTPVIQEKETPGLSYPRQTPTTPDEHVPRPFTTIVQKAVQTTPTLSHRYYSTKGSFQSHPIFQIETYDSCFAYFSHISTSPTSQFIL